MNSPLDITPNQEIKRITEFLKEILKKSSIKKVVIGLSEGIDSTTSVYLLSKVLSPENIITVHMPYFETDPSQFNMIVSKLSIPSENQHIVSIKSPVDTFKELLQISDDDQIRLGNIMARVRMITLFDFAKRNSALVCGTENKSEHLLGYYTRYGDEASDLEPIRHLYKTQIRILASSLEIPESIISKPPTAGLWPGQTDEKEFGFSYDEADHVLYYFYEKKLSLEDIEKKGYQNAKKIIKRAQDVHFKHEVPYSLV